MAENWLTYEQYVTSPVAVDITPQEFPGLASRAAREILNATQWRAAYVEDDQGVLRLMDCQAAMVSELYDSDRAAVSSAHGTVTSANNDGYSESYADPSTVRIDSAIRRHGILRQYLSAPELRWLLYKGGVYHAPARHY